MSRILFIQPYDSPKTSNGNGRKTAFLGRAGFETGYQVPGQHIFSLLDLNIEVHREKTVHDAIKQNILRERPEIIFVTFPSFAQGLQVEAVIRAVRRVSCDCKIIVGGAAISLIKNSPLRWWGKKYELSGCYDGFGMEIPDIISYLSGDGTDLPPDGFYVSKDAIFNKGKDVLVDGYSAEDLFSANGRIDFSKHLRSFREAGLRPIGLIEMMRGCRHRCIFCAINAKRLGCRFRSAQTVAGEADFLASHGIRHIHIIDPTFGLDQERAYSLLDLLASVSKRHGTTFEVVTRANMICEDFARAMKAAGVVRCDIGMETMSNDKLKAVRKGTNPKMIQRAVEQLAAQNIQVKLFHITFPGKISDETIAFLLSLADKKVDFLVQSSYLRTLPTPDSLPLFLEQDQKAFVPKRDSIQELMEFILINLCFKSMNTGYYESGLRELLKATIESGLPLESLFGKKQATLRGGFNLKLLPRFKKRSYTYVHSNGRPFSHSMCRA